MARRFNITGFCNPQKHYMVRLDDRLKIIKETYVDNEEYFIINRGRQYGKTTTLKALAKYLKKDYIIFSLDFQKLATANFENETAFSRAFAQSLSAALRMIPSEDTEKLEERLSALKIDAPSTGMIELFGCLSDMCKISPRPVVLMIDEVDSASNNQVFIDFLAQLRGYYLERENTPIFHSVILAGVYDIKNLKLKLRPETEHLYNSPWNIAADFDMDMSFSPAQIMSMLEEYEADRHTGMNVPLMAEEIYQYTAGYPVLVSSICKFIDEKLIPGNECENPADAWGKAGIEKAVKRLLVNSVPLFESMIRHLEEYPSMKQMFQAILFQGNEFSYNPDTKEINLSHMFGYAVNKNGKVQIANRIFEMRLYNYFLSEEELSSKIGTLAQRDKSYFIHDGRLDMDMTLKKFVEYFNDIYSDNDDKFIENHGRKIFLMFLRPIINGTGNYYIEAQTRDARRTDVIVDYLGEQFIIELKKWYGTEYNARGEAQLTDYLEYYHKDKGYMISFNFNKNKKTGIQEIRFGDKIIVEAVV